MIPKGYICLEPLPPISEAGLKAREYRAKKKREKEREIARAQLQLENDELQKQAARDRAKKSYEARKHLIKAKNEVKRAQETYENVANGYITVKQTRVHSNAVIFMPPSDDILQPDDSVAEAMKEERREINAAKQKRNRAGVTKTGVNDAMLAKALELK